MKSWVSKITTEDTDYDDVVFATAAGTAKVYVYFNHIFLAKALQLQNLPIKENNS